jgi:hypothetical protein
MTLSITVLYMQCRYAECCYVECRDLFTIMLNVIMLVVVMLNVIMLVVVMLNVVAPHWAQVNSVFLSRRHETGLKSVMSSNIFPEKNEAAGLFCTRSPLQIQAEPTNSSHIKFISLSSFRENAHPSLYLKLPLNTR